MTEEEIDAVAEELARIGGISWHAERFDVPLLGVIMERYRDRARVVIAALDRERTRQTLQASIPEPFDSSEGSAAAEIDQLRTGATVIYRLPGDRRAVTCRIDRIEDGRAYLVPFEQSTVGWVPLTGLVPA